MTGVELIIFGAGPAVGLVISFIAWLYEGNEESGGNPLEQMNHDFLI